jgi:hypothetical protein
MKTAKLALLMAMAAPMLAQNPTLPPPTTSQQATQRVDALAAQIRNLQLELEKDPVYQQWVQLKGELSNAEQLVGTVRHEEERKAQKDAADAKAAKLAAAAAKAKSASDH